MTGDGTGATLDALVELLQPYASKRQRRHIFPKSRRVEVRDLIIEQLEKLDKPKFDRVVAEENAEGQIGFEGAMWLNWHRARIQIASNVACWTVGEQELERWQNYLAKCQVEAEK